MKEYLYNTRCENCRIMKDPRELDKHRICYKCKYKRLKKIETTEVEENK